MRASLLILITAALAITVFHAPAATAQTSPVLIITLTSEHPPDHVMKMEPGEHTLMRVSVSGTAQWFVCAQNTVLNIALIFDAFPAWAGASFLPENVQLEIPSGQPGAALIPIGPEDSTLDIYWGEDRPKTNARFEYRIQTQTTGADACLPNPTPTEGTLRVAAAGDDIVEATTGAPTIDCETQFDPAVCQNTQQAPGGDSPGFDAALLVGAAIALVFVVRRRK